MFCNLASPFHTQRVSVISVSSAEDRGFFCMLIFNSLLVLLYIRLQHIAQMQIMEHIRDGNSQTTRGLYCVGDYATSVSFHFINSTFVLPETWISHSPSQHCIFPGWSTLPMAWYIPQKAVSPNGEGHTELLSFHLFWNLCAWTWAFLLVKAHAICRAKHELWWTLEAFEVREERKFWWEDCTDQLAVIRWSSHSRISVAVGLVPSIDSLAVPVWCQCL